MFSRRRKPSGPAGLDAAGGGGPLAKVTQYVIEADVLAETLDALREAGREGDELFVAWGGRVEDEGACVCITSALVPKQRCIHGPDGVGVIIDGDALFALNTTLYERGEMLVAQAHAHPTNAYHSGADDELAFATFPGALSLVVPDFARAGARARARWRWYRLEADHAWRRIPDSIEVAE